MNHVNAEARASYVAGCGTSKDQLEELITDTSLSVLDHRGLSERGLYSGFDAAIEPVIASISTVWRALHREFGAGRN